MWRRWIVRTVWRVAAILAMVLMVRFWLARSMREITDCSEDRGRS